MVRDARLARVRGARRVSGRARSTRGRRCTRSRRRSSRTAIRRVAGEVGPTDAGGAVARVAPEVDAAAAVAAGFAGGRHGSQRSGSKSPSRPLAAESRRGCRSPRTWRPRRPSVARRCSDRRCRTVRGRRVDGAGDELAGLALSARALQDVAAAAGRGGVEVAGHGSCRSAALRAPGRTRLPAARKTLLRPMSAAVGSATQVSGTPEQSQAASLAQVASASAAAYASWSAKGSSSAGHSAGAGGVARAAVVVGSDRVGVGAWRGRRGGTDSPCASAQVYRQVARSWRERHEQRRFRRDSGRRRGDLTSLAAKIPVASPWGSCRRGAPSGS
ncbi:hypothetical protein SAMN02745121_04566 [Nannocystis exedens]|uniref:Uncharacterized protein n=1 Tax=Nannocystis exedens TaxID=54 RepID=A0A1I2BAQ7_9BACT|nr:hypothetical protein SAMN02745121_04566 [Nannocystis exedens]